MSRLPALLGIFVVLAVSVGLAALNGGQLVTLRLGFVTLYGVPLTVVVFGSIIVGMVVMLVAGIHTDLRVRRILRERLAREDEEERARIFVDRNQRDLFDAVEEGRRDGPARTPPVPSEAPPAAREASTAPAETGPGGPEPPTDEPQAPPGRPQSRPAAPGVPREPRLPEEPEREGPTPPPERPGGEAVAPPAGERDEPSPGPREREEPPPET